MPLPKEMRDLEDGTSPELAEALKKAGQRFDASELEIGLPRTPLDARRRRKEPEVKFICRLCGSKEYEAVRENNGVYGPGGRSWVKHYVCGGCGVLFSDPKKFSAKPRSKKTRR